MDTEEIHPFTSPKGQIALTVVLTVLPSVAPFYGTFEFAVFLAVVSAAVIVLTYKKEFKEVAEGAKKLSSLGFPLSAIFIIVSIIGLTAIAVSLKPKLEQSDDAKPALTTEDVARAAEVLPVVNKEVPKKEVIVVEVPSYIEQPDSSLLTPAASRSADSTKTGGEGDSIDPMIKRLRMKTAGMNEYYDCLGERSKASAALSGLNFSATQIQNAYYYGRDSKMMVEDLGKWKQSAEKVFQEHKAVLPSIEIFNLAMPERRARNFLGIDNSGDNAWAEMDAKSKVLTALGKQLEDTSVCRKIQEAAAEQCRLSGNCSADE